MPTTTFDFTGKVSIVTGAAGGIGQAYAEALAAAGASVVVADIDGDGAEAVAAGIRAAGGAAAAATVDARLVAPLGGVQLSARTDEPMGLDEAKAWVRTNTVWASVFTVFFGLTVASTIPWLWLMSIDAHWYSTMYSWYTFASTFVSGMSLIAIFVVYLKRQDYLEYVNEEHLHDLGKFMFAFSIFWTYLWYSQFMLIWYANIPEETVYFKPRMQGPYAWVFFLNLIVNFVLPFLLLMRKGSKRNFTTMAYLGVVIIVGHWIDFFQMVMPGSVGEHYSMGWFEFGILALYAGLIMLLVGRSLAGKPLVARYHPFLKESVIHHT